MGTLCDGALTSCYQVRKRSLIWPTGLVLYSGCWGVLAPFGWSGWGLAGIEAGCAVCICLYFYDVVTEIFLAWRLDLTEDSLRWRSMFGSGEIPLTQVQRIRRRGWDGVGVIESAGRRPLLVKEGDHLPGFAAGVKQAAPHIDVRFPQRSCHQRGAQEDRTARRTS